MNGSKNTRFPIGHAVTVAELERDPYPVFERLREHEPISWLPALNMWYIVGYENVRSALFDSSRLTTASPRSTIYDTFGEHVLTSEGLMHDRYRSATKSPFAPAFIHSNLEAAIGAIAHSLVAGFSAHGRVDLRAELAARLPVQVMLLLCEMPADAEPRMRRWFDSFEAALANFTQDESVRAAARANLGEFHDLIDGAIHSTGARNEHSLLVHLVNAPPDRRLTDDEIRRNLSIIFFGGISTVEALLLNCIWALFEHPTAMNRVWQEPAMIPQVIEETMRWLSPVQSATRHVSETFEWQGIEFAAHETVNCMLGAANRDPSVFADPDRFDLDRANSRRHLGFATGAHACLGSHLAKTEVRIALETLVSSFPRLRLERSLTEPPSGYEFRQSRKLTVGWDV